MRRRELLGALTTLPFAGCLRLTQGAPETVTVTITPVPATETPTNTPTSPTGTATPQEQMVDETVTIKSQSTESWRFQLSESHTIKSYMAIREGPKVVYKLLKESEFEKYINGENFDVIRESTYERLSYNYSVELEKGAYVHLLENSAIYPSKVYVSVKREN